MKLLYLLLVGSPLLAQALTVPQFQRIAHACVADADLTDLTAIVKTESSFRPNAISINRPETVARSLGYSSGRIFLWKQPKGKAESARWARELMKQGMTLSVGLMQVNAEESHYTVEQLLDPCTNLRVGWRLFVQKYNQAAKRIGPGQAALRLALSAYNSGSFTEGFANGYVSASLRNVP